MARACAGSRTGCAGLVSDHAHADHVFHLLNCGNHAFFGAAFYIASIRRFGSGSGFCRLFIRLAIWIIPLPWIAIEFGWLLAEIGRQPWAIEGVLPTFLAASGLKLHQIMITLSGFVLIYTVLLQTGALSKVNEIFMDIVGGDDINLMQIIGFPQVFGFAIVVGILNTIVGTALGAIASLVYNLLVRVLGGFQLGFTSN